MTKLNKDRLENYSRRSNAGAKLAKQRRESSISPLLNITSVISHAAALVAEADMATSLADCSITLSRRADGNFWTEGIRRQGTVPWGSDANYKVFRNVVTDYHADPTGASDSTAAIQAAINDGQRCGERCNGSTLKSAIVYFPPGTYLVSSTIRANNWPTIRAASSFVGLGVLSTNEYVGGTGPDGGDAEYYVNTARFYSQIRNLRIDIISTDPNAYVCAIHYQVAQATSLQDMELIATTGTTQQGIFSENGSGGIMSDVTFRGGNFGFCEIQLLTIICSKHTFTNSFGWMVAISNLVGYPDYLGLGMGLSLRIQGGDVGICLVNPDGNGNIGSVSFVDSQITGVTTAIIVSPISSSPGSGTTGLILDNTRIGGPIVDTAGSSVPYSREQSLLGGRVDGLDSPPYFERKKNQYANKPVDDFVQLKTLGARGDGVSDDTAAIQRAF
ncbi:hypothetical protein HK57_00283 [Aspergillus ustus]|uniref:Rhamnogalacturonase A/B/Epimerase-like pectate lyase domain-containing protein n=1 Tax=Aspergillus ustus TaxID=40382 RepID=A0A0C1E305_ASPUT|nr:hypothetical protein HK57_00283 [Aspergillus ustus]